MWYCKLIVNDIVTTTSFVGRGEHQKVTSQRAKIYWSLEKVDNDTVERAMRLLKNSMYGLKKFV